MAESLAMIGSWILGSGGTAAAGTAAAAGGAAAGAGAATAVGAMAVGSALGAGVSLYTGMKQSSEAKDAAAQAKKQSEMEMNKANQKAPNIGAILEANRNAGSNTSLTGPSGVGGGSLLLGSNTLLGL